MFDMSLTLTRRHQGGRNVTAIGKTRLGQRREVKDSKSMRDEEGQITNVYLQIIMLERSYFITDFIVDQSLPEILKISRCWLYSGSKKGFSIKKDECTY